ncbi:mitochondrial chaperone BCS1-B [Phytophthora nicotianae]|uniref:Mitochondrial chaperone BCS1-B n=1 Tax=Phytophthora nicotianae TaxID=4792 RepID=A0A0W8D1B1_PHYNI|nr:mitochondrial chaperone BCS1-B [Phytophthora nicotianae]
MVDEDFSQMYHHLGNLRKACRRSGVVLPEVVFLCWKRQERGALKLLAAKLRVGTKREHAAIAKTDDTERTIGDGGEETPVDLEEDEVDDNNTAEPEEEPPRKISRLTEDVRKEPAAVFSNQVIVNTFAEYGEQQLHRGHTGKGVAHLRAARAIRDYPCPITSGTEARAVPLVGSKMATQVEQILSTGKLEEKPKLDDAEKHNLPKLVHEVHEAPAKCSENQILVDELTKFREHELNFRSVSKENRAVRPENRSLVDALTDYGSSHLHSGHVGKGVAHLRAALAIRDSEIVVTSGKQAAESIKYVGAQIGAKIDQILEHGHADTDDDVDDQDEEGSEFGHREPSGTPQIVHEVRSKPARVQGNQEIVDALSAHGERQLVKWHTGQGTAFMRAARRLRDAAELVTSGTVAKALGCIGNKVATFIDAMTCESADEAEEIIEEAEK